VFLKASELPEWRVVALSTKGGVSHDHGHVRDHVTWARLLAKHINRVSTRYSKNFLTTTLSKPLILRSFIFSGPIISRLFSNRGGHELSARRMSPWSSNIKILLCLPIYMLTRRTWGWGWTKGWKRHSRSEVIIEKYIESVVLLRKLVLVLWTVYCELYAVNCVLWTVSR
jgi:hypothetical protein